MLSFLPGFILLPIHFLLQCLNLAFWGTLIVALGLVKLVLPLPPLTRGLNRLLNSCMGGFALLSTALINLFNNVQWDYRIEGDFDRHGWYLMMANHISWLDIVVLMHFATGRIPATKFFIKQELLWVPFIGLGAWALDMPFMRRYSRHFVARHPHLKGKDIEATRKSCEKFQQLPTTVVNFVEGTRFTDCKHRDKNSPYQHLLPPKAGGVAFTLTCMNNLLSNIVDVTLVYPDNNGHVMLDLLCGRLKKVIIEVQILPVNADMIGDYQNDPEFRASFQHWINQYWHRKDQRIQELTGNEWNN
ncbi:acyltransferase [Lacimicrobium alkaliphilum]|uniref:Acyltransferase n=1 Tax=Lacimicrobium alkaliphilum TaxID=1526571 RepID=A0A0U3B2E1_9ALTE|nr:acyltransferase [Lacimicrobium alkaliphilum]ALS99232.1 acyltransferase [Lacimicrobium alkaliphilum]